MLRFLTAGESHGPALTVIVEGLPAGLPITIEEVAAELTNQLLPGVILTPGALGTLPLLQGAGFAYVT